MLPPHKGVSMGKWIDRTNERYGRWTYLAPDVGGWVARCDCGTIEVVRALHGRSCGCEQREAATRHGLEGTKVYNVWGSMLQRCRNPRHRAFHNYGGRGIRVCDRWLDFRNFFADMGHAPAGLTLDRINNDGHYSPENCRWATWSTQNRNKARRNPCPESLPL